MKSLLLHKGLRRYGLLVLAAVFFLLSFLFNKLYTSRTSAGREARLASNYIQEHEKDFEGFIRDTALIGRLVNSAESLSEFEQLEKKKYGIFLYAINQFGEQEMKFWSNQLAVPPSDLLQAQDGEYFRKLPNGWYVLIRKTLPAGDTLSGILSFAVIPVESEFFVTNEYLPQKFAYSKDAGKRVKISDGKATDFPIKSSKGQTLFYLDKKVTMSVPFNDRQTLLLRFAGVLALFFFIHILAERVARRGLKWRAIGILSLILLVLRLLTYYFPQLLNLRQFELFSPVIYGSNAVQRSLGDLLINAVLFCWIVLFAWSELRYEENPGSKFSRKWRVVTGILSLVLLIFSTFILAAVIRSMVADSKISFDVTNFFGLNWYTVIGFFILACLSLSYYYFSQLLFRLIFPLFEGRNYLIYFSIGFAGLAYLTLRSGNNKEVLFYIPVLLWLLGYTWLVNRKGVIFNKVRINIAGILSWIFIFSISISLIMLSQNKYVEWEHRKSIAEKLSVQTEQSTESIINITMKYLDNDFLSSNFQRLKQSEENKYIRDSILRANFSIYLAKYDTRLYIFDSLNRPLFNEDAYTYEELNLILNVQSKEVSSPGLYYYESSPDRFKYITRRDVLDSASQKMGSLFIVSSPKSYSREALFAQLFVSSKGGDPENSPIYSYAIYEKGKMISEPGNYSFPISLTESELPREEVVRHRNGDYEELWYRASTDKVVVVARKRETTIEAITLFSYIFCSFLVLVAFVQFISLVLKAASDWRGFRKLMEINIRSQVHSTIIFISLFSFLIIGAATISFFISRNRLNNSDKLSRTMKIMVNEMQKKMADHTIFDDVVKIYDSVTNKDLQVLVKDVSDIHGVNVNVYDLKGDLQVSSEGNVYNKGVLSRKMNPGAFYHLSRMRQVLRVQDEKIGRFSYFSIYSPVRNEDGQAYAYVNIPYFTSKQELRQEISNFLVAIINLNAFIFLIAGLIALLITNRITNSFSLISEKMREVNLGKLNEQIVWNRNDEIGELVKEYNKMVAKLGESASALAKSEREGAWREMARQVAHEIKNPLTPMKLSIQYLQKAIDNNQPNVKELSGTVANTLVEQIDHLSKIAADFSQFANIGNTNVTRFDLHDVIGSLKKLYTTDERVQFDWKPVSRPAFLDADKTQMNRLFTNLFANAVEACNGNSVCLIEVSEMIHDDVIRVSIRDNGEGIAPEMQERIFIPNFTTKSSGTGLGLAMCKSIAEQAKGRIWFETERGKGTTFHVELPVANG